MIYKINKIILLILNGYTLIFGNRFWIKNPVNRNILAFSKTNVKRDHSELGLESSAFAFFWLLKALDAETIPDQVRDRAQHDLLGEILDNTKVLL